MEGFIMPYPNSHSDDTPSKLQKLEDENQRLIRAVEELAILNDLARSISASLNSQEIIQTVIRRSLRAIHAEQGVITLIEQKTDEPTKTYVRTMNSSVEHEKYHLDQNLLGWMHLNKKPIIINNPKEDDRFRGVKWDESIHSFLCVPLITKGNLKGVLTVYNKKGIDIFTEDDQRLLSIIASQSAQVIENARLNEEELLLQRMKEQLDLARTIQIDLLPKISPVIEGYDIAGSSIPAQTVGGDYFDFVTIDSSHLVLCLGDVSGKGLPAALLMANVQATTRGISLVASSPGDCIQRSNNLLFQSTSPEKFVTLFYGLLDTHNHHLTFANAGHDNPMFFNKEKELQRLKSGGPPLGIVPNFAFEEETILINPGNTLIIYSDGITDAMNSNQELFGEERLMHIIINNQTISSKELIDKIHITINEFIGKTPQMDDMTLIVVKRISP
jgi:sigma-B regulation protein RsbU (phosphoserine phosphatase)